MQRIFAGLIALLVAPSGSAPANEPCRIAAARYTLIGAPSFTAMFVQRPPRADWGDLTLKISSADSGRDYWFLLGQGNGRFSDVWTASTDDPTAPGWQPTAKPAGPHIDAGAFFALRVDMSVIGDAPRANDPAPAYIFMPGLASALWYGVALSNGERESMPRAVFVRAGCSAHLRD